MANSNIQKGVLYLLLAVVESQYWRTSGDFIAGLDVFQKWPRGSTGISCFPFRPLPV
jgi:hypothetical protein